MDDLAPIQLFRRPSPTGDYWYRYDDVQYAAPVAETGERMGDGRVTVHCTEYPVLSYAPKGAWIDNHGTKRWVNRNARKRFACPTRREAMDSFIMRKLAQKRILNAQLRRCEIALHRAQRLAPGIK